VAFCKQALTDPGPLVRRRAATRCGELPRELGSPLLFAHLAGETHEVVWFAAHDVLRSWHSSLPPCRVLALATASDREDVLAAWRAAVPQ
jgi:hypothetical protein